MPLYVLHGEEFKTLQSLRKRVRAIRDSYSDDVNLSADDFAFMCDLLKRHESADIKSGCGIREIFVRQEPIHHTRGFWLRRIDGSETDFSFEMCLRNKPEPRIIKFKAACRTAIKFEVIRFKEKFFAQQHSAKCQITGETITKQTAHVDHAPPWTFDQIVMAFINEKHIDVDMVKINGIQQDCMLENSITDKQLERQFIEYHNQRANLRVISGFANLSIVKRIKEGYENRNRH